MALHFDIADLEKYLGSKGKERIVRKECWLRDGERIYIRYLEDGRYALNKFLNDEYEQVNGQTPGAEDKP